MITCLNTEKQMRMHLPRRGALFAAGLFASLGLVVGPFLHPATARAYDGKYYEWCKDSLGDSDDVCCANAGGEWSNESCWDPAVLHPIVTPMPTVTQRIQPPAIAPVP